MLSRNMSAPSGIGCYDGPQKSSLIENKILSKEMYEYLEIEENTRVSCKTFLKLFWNRVKSNCLINPKDRWVILPDEKLRKLLKLDTNLRLTVYNTNLFLTQHVVREI